METRLDDELRPAGNIAIAVGPIVALGTAGLLARFRDTAGATNVALVLAIIVVLAALAGRTAGFATAITAAMGYNYFHTQPYNSLRIHAARDVVTVGLLVLIGVVVSEIGAWRRRARRLSTLRLTAGQALEKSAALLATGGSVEDMWTLIRDVLMIELHLVDCRYESTNTSALPTLPRSGSIVAQSMHLKRYGFALPSGGVAIPVAARGQKLGLIVLVPDDRFGSSHDARALAIALADQYAMALYLDRASPVRSPVETDSQRQSR
jgi:Domain of unknown function (DUF4118)